MAHIPYTMYGSGGFHLPIIDIIQTINSSHHMCKKQKPSKSIISTSRKGLKKESSSNENEKLEKQLPSMCERKSVSYNSFPKASSAKEDEEKLKKKTISKTKIMRFRKNGLHAGSKFFNCCCDRDSDGVGEKKSLQVLFKAGKNGNVFDKDELYEEELNFSSLRSLIKSSADLKRKRSFADYIKIKRRKRIGL